MARILLIFVHPVLEKSRVHRELLQHIPDADITDMDACLLTPFRISKQVINADLCCLDKGCKLTALCIVYFFSALIIAVNSAG